MNTESPSSFLGFLIGDSPFSGEPVVNLHPLIKKPLFRKPFVNLLELLLKVQLPLFLIGAVLGRARHNELELLASLFCSPGREKATAQMLIDRQAKKLRSYGQPLHSFYDFFMHTELEKMGVAWPQLISQLARHKILVWPDLGPVLDICLEEAVGFGVLFPEETAAFWREANETHDPDLWNRWRTAGMNLPEEFSPILLAKFEADVLTMTAIYVADQVPGLLDPLNLRQYLAAI